MARSAKEMTAEQPIPTAAQVARILVELAEADRDVDQEPMTHMRLQKLLYYVQGWSLARRGEPAFADRIEAWEHGPVVPSLYGRLKRFGKDPIPAAALDAGGVDEALRAFIASVWEDYRGHSAIMLRTRTHAEPPWKQAWDNRQAPNHGQEPITPEALRDYFRSIAPQGVRRYRRQPPGPSWFEEPIHNTR